MRRGRQRAGQALRPLIPREQATQFWKITEYENDPASNSPALVRTSKLSAKRQVPPSQPPMQQPDPLE